jgi:ABC-2 type transport system permease protein
LPSPKGGRFGWLLRKDTRELVTSQAYWLLLLVVGLLVGHAFLTATATYAELSGAGGGTAVLSQGLSPLDGIIVPTFGAYDIAATFLLPFVVIRLVATERQTGALKLVLQSSASRRRLMLSKVVVLLACWVVALVPGVIALIMWTLAGGHLHAAEVGTVIVGHLVLAGITVGIAAAAGSIAQSAASAAITALTFTLGMWALDFVGAVRGGFLQEIARYTPESVVRTFEHGELRLATVLIAAVVSAAGVAVAIVSLDLGSTARQRSGRWAAILFIAAIAAVGASRFRASWDVSEDRRNSFDAADERLLGSIHDPLHIEVHLGGEDPRRVDLEREVLSKLRRVMRVRVDYVEGSGTGMTARSDHYGEMIYTLRGKSDTTRSVTAPIILENIYRLAGFAAPVSDGETASYPGYPSTRVPSGIPLVFFVVWPLLVGVLWWKLELQVLAGNGRRAASPSN